MVGDFHVESGSVLTTDEAGSHANAAACFHVQVGKVGGVDELVVHEHPQLVVLGGLVNNFCLGHDDFGMAVSVGDLNHKGGTVLATHKSGHQANTTVRVQVHVGKFCRADKLVVDEHPRTLGLSGFFDKFVLGHLHGGVAGSVGDFHVESGGVLTAHEAWHQTNATACFQVHVSDVSSADELVVDEHPRALSFVGLFGDFVLCHLNGGVPRCVCNFNVKFRISVHVCSPMRE